MFQSTPRFSPCSLWEQRHISDCITSTGGEGGRSSSTPSHSVCLPNNVQRAKLTTCTAFCVTRIIATSLRMAWAVSPGNTSLASAAQIFVYAGIVILIVTNLFFAQRFVRAQHPRVGWKKTFSLPIGIWALVCCIAVFLLIVSVIVQTYLRDPFSQQSAQEIQLFSNIIFTITALLPIPIVGISAIAKSYPTLKPKPIDNFGKGSLNRKMVIIFSSATILSIGAIYRASITYVNPVPLDAPVPWYFSRASFYIFNFSLDFLLITLWLIVRIDAQFIIPDGANGPMTYGNGFHFAARSTSGRRSPIDRASTIPTPSLTRAGSWGTLRNYMTTTGDEPRLKTPVSRLKTPISRPEMIYKTPESGTTYRPQHQTPISADRYFRTCSRGTSFWNSSVTAASLSNTVAGRTDSAYEASSDNHQTEDIRKFPIAINSIDLRRATAAALRAAAAEQEAAIYARTAQWSDLNSANRFDVRSLSCYSVRSDLRPGSTTTAAFSPRL